MVLLINGSLFSVHVARRNNAYLGIGRTQGKSDVQKANIVCSTQRMKANFFLAVLFVRQNQQRLVKKYLLGFRLANTVLFSALFLALPASHSNPVIRT
ncbi:hypothetical protein [Methylomonas sp. WSC-6]|uniref:Transposase n=1 Tax=Methylomonas rivi TaxID=2952226 RepID=A0ABT1U4A0_9GAMM|nr:hypothetical protein [Methylomonas sp. WSC-6]MCQ8128662.1 hypothetical protein [Methylomonas sp. WSC-6]